MNLRLAIIYEDKKVYVDFTPAKFREILKKYYKKYKSIDKAMDMVESDLKKETMTK